MEVEIAVIFTLRFKHTCQAFLVLTFSPPSAKMFNVVILNMASFLKPTPRSDWLPGTVPGHGHQSEH